MQFCVKSMSDPAQQHPETKYYSPAVFPKSPFAFFLNGPHKLTFIRTPCPDFLEVACSRVPPGGRPRSCQPQANMLNLGGAAGAIVSMASTAQQVLAAAPSCKAAEVMVEGETLLVLLLCAPCQRTALQGSPSNG